MLFDTHAHLTDERFDADREDVLKRAKENGVISVVEIADSPKSIGKARDFCERFTGREGFPEIYWAAGFHPHYAAAFSENDFDIMKKSAGEPRCVAVGEIGMDSVKSESTKEEQTQLFKRTFRIALETGKPAVIHCRESETDVLALLKDFLKPGPKDSPGVIHCFSGSERFAQDALELGFYIGVDGPVTYPNAKSLREVLKTVPLDRLVLETDAPYLPPQSYRGKRNEPAYLGPIAEGLAMLFGKSRDEIERITTENAKKLYRI
jgi:TatD DNase family protein